MVRFLPPSGLVHNITALRARYREVFEKAEGDEPLAISHLYPLRACVSLAGEIGKAMKRMGAEKLLSALGREIESLRKVRGWENVEPAEVKMWVEQAIQRVEREDSRNKVVEAVDVLVRPGRCLEWGLSALERINDFLKKGASGAEGQKAELLEICVEKYAISIDRSSKTPAEWLVSIAARWRDHDEKSDQDVHGKYDKAIKILAASLGVPVPPATKRNNGGGSGPRSGPGNNSGPVFH